MIGIRMITSSKRHSHTEFLEILRGSKELMNEDPDHEVIFSLERLEQYARSLAGELTVAPKIKRGKSLLPDLKRCEPKLAKVYQKLVTAIRSKQEVSPAAEWFIDNFHIIEAQIRDIKLNLPPRYYYGLPQLDSGELKGYPRIYALALAFFAHTDSRLDVITLQKFLLAYQTVAPLKIGELWALSITLRIVLVQHLTLLAQRISTARENSKMADLLAERLLELAAFPEALPAKEKNFSSILSKELNDPKGFNRSFVVQLILRLRDQDPDVWPAIEWIEKQLAKVSTSAERLTRLEHHSQAAGQITIGNIIGSMRLLSAMDWRDFFESVHTLEQVLALDPVYPKMDFATRDSYRHAVEQIAKGAKRTEREIAESAIALSGSAPSLSRERHIGSFLVGENRRELEIQSGYRASLRETLLRWLRPYKIISYLGAVLFLSIAFLLPVLFYFEKLGHADRIFLFFFALVASFPASELALSLLHYLVNFFVLPKTLPRMETKDGLPPGSETFVVIPTLFTSVPGVLELLKNIEIHYLANPEDGLYFALLSDFTDADSEHLPEDNRLLEAARFGIENLNLRYFPDQAPRFHLFHRKRQWNPSEEKWIGWERKRGKLLEFNRLLRGAVDTSFVIKTADASQNFRTRYVITLDSDTQIPRDAARLLVGTISHPLNQPFFDKDKGRVTKGYGILQPRISISSASATASRFAKISSGNIGLDPYTTAVSDVYQDLFQEGSYTGKGLYVVDTFELALENRVPENTILSHDLFEGLYARSGLVTDVELYDDYPTDHETFNGRQHRWTRGDWQIAPWLLPLALTADRRWRRNKITLLSRWKIFDNLRRSLVPVATLIWLGLGWTVLPGSPIIWTSLILLMYLFPVYSTVITGEWLRRRGVTWRGHAASGWHDTQIKVGQIVITVAFLPKQAWTLLDAIFRALWRSFVSRKKILEWTTHAQLEKKRKRHLSPIDALSPGPAIALLTALGIWKLQPSALILAFPFLLTWLTNPLLQRWLGKTPRKKERELNEKEQAEFRSYARATWHFFETFVGEKGNWLAPDNYQEVPNPVIAYRTSPTNIGLQLLSIVAAYDLGYVGHLELLELLEKIFATLDRLPRNRGHFFNWYNTLTLEPLPPGYISTVDSGNLAGHLLTLKQFLHELTVSPRSEHKARSGISDTLLQLKNSLALIHTIPPVAGAATPELFSKAVDEAIITIAAKGDLKTIFPELEKKLDLARDILSTLKAHDGNESFSLTQVWLDTAFKQISQLQRDFRAQQGELRERETFLISRCEEIVTEMDFRFLYDEKRKLFVIGFNSAEMRRDSSYYDLLASESRLASFVAIAKGDIAQEHWFRLGRQFAPLEGGRALIAWTATMFEYLMPVLIMHRYKNTLLDETYRAIVVRQIEYGMQKGVPWGVSEAGFNARDLQLNYQYGPFGVPGLGLKRGLSDELVISPYSTFLAAMISPVAALANLRNLVKLGAFSRFGFYESVDYTPERVPSKQTHVILKSFMAHHQGMSLVAIDNLLHNFVMQKRFHEEPRVLATQLLLQEKVPKSIAIVRPRAEEVFDRGYQGAAGIIDPRLYSDVRLSSPRTQLLSNGYYSTMVTTTGGGFSFSGKTAVSRWREDATRDNWGQFFYVRNRANNTYWSAAYQPIANEPEKYEAHLAEDRVEILRRDGLSVTRTEILVSPEDNVELRKISVTNDARESREFEITSFMEVVLAKPEDDMAHPAFSNLFVQTEFVPDCATLLANRRKRSNQEAQVWGFHLVVTESPVVGSVQFETDRARFLGRGRGPADPIVILENRPLSNTAGSVLDPIFSLRQTVLIQPGNTVSVLFVTGTAGSRDDALGLADRYRESHMFSRESDMAWTQSQVQLRHLNISSARAQSFQKLAGRILYRDSSLRAGTQILAKNSRAQSNLWAYGISGDLPIILSRISEEKDMPMIRVLLHAHEYFRLKGLVCDLVILNERDPSYLQSLQDEIQRQIRMSGSQALLDKPGGVFLRRTDLLPAEDVILLRTVAAVSINADRGTIEEQLLYRKPQAELPPEFAPTKTRSSYPEVSYSEPALAFFNGLGGFTENFHEYVIVLREGQCTPAPWINVIANQHDFGFLISESGSGYTWSANSRENRLTPWSNDPVSDPPGEVIYLRDEETGEVWTPTPLPIRDAEPYIIRHGQGYTRFEHLSHGIEQKLDVFVATEAGVKFSRLLLKNMGRTERQISVTSYVEWVLGFHRSKSAAYLIPTADAETGAIFVRNPYNNEFGTRVAFADISETKRTFTCDRREFIGRNGNLKSPAALKRTGLTGSSGAGLDPCAAFQAKIKLAPGEEKTIVVLLGEAESEDAARTLILNYRKNELVEAAHKAALNLWEKTLQTIEIKTPDLAMNALVNRWLLYQTLSCRIWARSAFYQSGGAYGFRDQLQDSMALVYAKPEITRQQILIAAARQFLEGDVQHWWHPPSGRGVRTHFSDDLLWLPFVVSYYIQRTGDHSLLEELVPFIEAPLLPTGQDDAYLEPKITDLKASIFEHCARALDRSLAVGSHGLPLMGSGDWNDGMNRVGHEGKGESVWVAWFLYSTLEMFLPYCDENRSTARASAYRAHLEHLKKAVEENAWDGDWYRRAFFDDGTPLGSSANEECRIDSISQSWAVLSKAADPKRAKRAMAAVDEYLVHRSDGLVKLFTPPFDKTSLDPGYIKGYVPGVRENGGQYTHAAIWTLMAYAELGDGDRAAELYALLNPINHSSTRAGLQKYKVEPYVIAADIYGMPPHVGRGGWTWYTGSSSWMYRAALESILGFDLQGKRFRVNPKVPGSWQQFEITYRHEKAVYNISVIKEPSLLEIKTELNGAPLSDGWVPITDQAGEFAVLVRIP